jgi:hypothetical protein
MRNCPRFAVLWIALVAVSVSLQAQSGAAPRTGPGNPSAFHALPFGGACEPSWISTFGGMPGVDGSISGMAVYDDGHGDGPALFAGGGFTLAGDVKALNIARWNGTSWAPLGSGIDGGVDALAVFDDGSGPALYAGGSFTHAGGVTANSIARWDGSAWTALGSGVSGASTFRTVRALTVWDDGDGPALYVGGSFTSAGGVAASYLARWDGTSFSPVGGGLDSQVFSLTTFDSGAGAGLYVGGEFTHAGALSANCIAKWNGSSWSAFGVGMNNEVRAMAFYDEGHGGGPVLFAGGGFTLAGGVTAQRIARWDGAAWSPVVNGVRNGGHPAVNALAVFDDGSGVGSALYVGGAFDDAGSQPDANDIARWNGNFWSKLENGVDGTVLALATFDDGNGGGATLHIGGSFISAGTAAARSAAKWDGASWSSLGRGTSLDVRALAVLDDGQGPALYAGGAFKSIGGVAADRIAKWDGASWAPLGSGVDNVVSALAVYDDGAGPALYAAGSFSNAGGAPASRIAKWDGASWTPLGSGIQGVVYALCVYDDGSGPALYAGGTIFGAGGLGSGSIVRWNGASWSVPNSFGWRVKTLAVFDDGSGSGPWLYAGGDLDSSSNPGCIKRWNGGSWVGLGSGVRNDPNQGAYVSALAVYDDGLGGGRALYASGNFTHAGSGAANRIARWDGLAWSPLASGLGGFNGYALAVFDDGNGPALYAGGDFPSAGGAAAKHVARWNGVGWSELGGGVNGSVLALAVFDPPGATGPALIAGGSFSSPFDCVDAFIARWQGCHDTSAPTLQCPPGFVVREEPGSPPGESVTFTVTASDEVDPSPTVVCVPPSGSIFPPGTTSVSCTATDASGNQATCAFDVTVRTMTRVR